MKRRPWGLAAILALALFCSATCGPTAENTATKKTPPNEKAVTNSKAVANKPAVFNMKEVSLYDQKERAAISEYPIFGGQIASLRLQPAKEVKAYPKLNSKQPLYGAIVFDDDPKKQGRAAKFDFVLDESGSTNNTSQKIAKAEADKPGANSPKRRYDRLYVDTDRNLDLTNDAVVCPMEDPPKGLARLFDGPQTTVIFNPVRMPLDNEPNAKGQAISLLPVIILYGKTYEGNAGRMMFMAASGRKGEVRLGKRPYQALLVPLSGMVDRMNHPNTPLLLTPVGSPRPLGLASDMNTLAAIRYSDGEFYRFSASPSGDRLTVRPCGGERGAFALSVGDKKIAPLGIFGSLAWRESASKETVLLLDEPGIPIQCERAKTARYRLPVGDYRPLRLIADCGGLRISLRPDFTLNSGAGTIEVRKDKPYLLDFAAKPEVFFRAPSATETFKPGDQIWIGAILRIPSNGFLVDGIEDRSKKVGETTSTADDGTQLTSPRYASLDATVVITDSSGKKVAEGTMPFG